MLPDQFDSGFPFRSSMRLKPSLLKYHRNEIPDMLFVLNNYSNTRPFHVIPLFFLPSDRTVPNCIRK